jgi:hypothetical protein
MRLMQLLLKITINVTVSTQLRIREGHRHPTGQKHKNVGRLQSRPVFHELLLLLFILTANGFLPGENGTTIRHNTQITRITQNNTPRSNETQHTKQYTQ